MRALMLLILLVVSGLAQDREVFYYFGERGNVAETVGVTPWSRPGYTRDVLLKCAAAGVDGVVGLDQWSKNGDPATDVKWSAWMHEMCDLADSLGLSLYPQVWNGSKYAYGFPDYIETYNSAKKSKFFVQRIQLEPGVRGFLSFKLPADFSHRLFQLRVFSVSGNVRYMLFRDDVDQQVLVHKANISAGTNLLPFHSLDNSTSWLMYFRSENPTPTSVLVTNLSERAPLADESLGALPDSGKYAFCGNTASGFYAARTMNPDCTEAFYRVAMRQSLCFWQEFKDEPAIKGVWFSLDEVPVMGQQSYDNFDTAGEAYTGMVERAAWFNYALWGKPAMGWVDCLGGHNSTEFERAATGMHTAFLPDAPFFGYAWNESNKAALRKELELFAPGEVGAAIYLGTNDLDSAKVTMDAYGVSRCLLFNWEYNKWLDSLSTIVSCLR